MPKKAEFLTSSASPDRFPPEDLAEVAFLGRSNVGKSSLINALVGHSRLAFTSNTPGRTRTINFYRVEEECCLVDLPGYGWARVPRQESESWKRLAEQYLLRRGNLRLCFLILDARRGWMELDLQLGKWLDFHRRRFLVIATKIDKLNQTEQRRGLAAIAQYGDEPLPFSALSGRGVREIWQAISTTLDKSQA